MSQTLAFDHVHLSAPDQAAASQWYIEHLGADFTDYVEENMAYSKSLGRVSEALRSWGRHQVLDRAHLPNFVFTPDDIVVALGQDGLVANTMKFAVMCSA